jgi:hypothetical protein
MVVYLSVAHHPDRLIFIGDRLVAASQVNDSQPLIPLAQPLPSTIPSESGPRCRMADRAFRKPLPALGPKAPTIPHMCYTFGVEC